MKSEVGTGEAERNPKIYIRVLFWFLALVVTGFALYPKLTLPEPAAMEGTTQYYDHILAFTTLIAVGAAGWGLHMRLVAGVALWAVVLEVGQNFSPGRDASLIDLLASLAGVALGCGVARVAFPK